MIRFGTGGWRAEIGVDFIKSNIEKVTQGICELMREEGKTDKPVVLGHDRRFLSDSAAMWIAEVLGGNGISVLYISRSAPTPLVMFDVKDMGLHYGIEVTASHNPASYNGMKLIVEEGRDASVETTSKLETIIDNVTDVKRMPFAEAIEKGLILDVKNPFNDFIDSILSQLDIDLIRKAGPRILFDPMHGSGTYPLTVILNTTRCTLDTIHYNKDAYFGGDMPAPNKNVLWDLSRRVSNGGYDLGIAFDGDGDRLGIIDPCGEYIDANRILVMLYYYLHEYRGWKGPVVRNCATTHMLDLVAESFGERCYEVPVGFKYISAKIDEADAVLGGESSGGLTVRGHIHGKDSVYAAVLFIEMICAIGKTPSEFWCELTEKYGVHEMAEDNMRFTLEEKERIEHILFKEKKIPDFSRGIKAISYEDGCVITFEDGAFIICRFSGTEPLLRIFAEDTNADKARKIISQMKEFLSL
ncbi:MAG: phosphoglucomutase/phosphomannomutase family protein [Clostridia bacterium]|nr:phosphoglucomutase/phosphomannomutase family protein [Clostridia bacterium]